MFDIYVSAQTANSRLLSKGENLARVINAISWPDGNVIFPSFQNVILSEGYWNGDMEHTVILTVSGTYRPDAMERHAEELRARLGQESVMVVSDIPVTNWSPVYRNDRIDTRTTENYTLREGIGQSPYSYEAITDSDREPTHWIHFTNRY